MLIGAGADVEAKNNVSASFVAWPTPGHRLRDAHDNRSSRSFTLFRDGPSTRDMPSFPS